MVIFSLGRDLNTIWWFSVLAWDLLHFWSRTQDVWWNRCMIHSFGVICNLLYYFDCDVNVWVLTNKFRLDSSHNLICEAGDIFVQSAPMSANITVTRIRNQHKYLSALFRSRTRSTNGMIAESCQGMQPTIPLADKVELPMPAESTAILENLIWFTQEKI